MSGNLKYLTTCKNCNKERIARGDVIKKAEKEGRPLYCKPCSNKLFHGSPRKGTGVKNNSELEYTRRSYYKAKQRCRLGKKHHAAYENVQFKFNSFEEFFSLLGSRPLGYSLDRINPLGNYEPGNVRWATLEQQAANRLPKNYWKNKSEC